VRVVVTGVAGFVGSYLAPALAKAGHEVIGLGVWNDAPERARVREIRGLAAWDHCDVAEWDDVRRAMVRWTPEAIVHLAAQSSGAQSFAAPRETFATNALGTLHVLEAAHQHRAGGGDAPRVLLVGSSEVYGQTPDARPVAEDAPLRPRNPYAASKAAADLLGFQYALAYKVPVVRVRAFAHTGPGQSPVFALSSFAEQIARAEAQGEPAAVQAGNLSVVRDYLDVRDVVDAYILLLTKGEPGEVYNVCSGDGRPLRELLHTLADSARVRVNVTEVEARLRPADLAYLVGDPEKLMRTTGWRPRRPLSACLHALLDHWRQNVSVTAAH
jgi:GDP-4-dehydro-6-deoxy-D-mannose reductase